MFRSLKKIITFIIILILLICAFITYQGYTMYKEVISKESIEKKVEKIKEYDNYISISDVPQTYKDATIAVEDHRFYYHHGIDVITTFRSLIENIRNKELTNGGSTITQQVARNFYFSQEKSFIRKIAELFVAFDLEKNYNKDDILEMYLNIIYFGDGYTGLKQASYGYFRKSPYKLNLSEQTMLVGIPNAPSIYSPSTNPDLTKKRQEQVVKAMLKYKYISKDEANEIKNTDLPID